MEVIDVLRMNEGTGKSSYANNSLLQVIIILLLPLLIINFMYFIQNYRIKSYRPNSFSHKEVIDMTMPIARAAITNVYCNMSPTTRTMCMADLGCSSGPNTLFVMSELVRTVYETCEKSGRESPEFQVYLNDLPKNDFNTIFRSLEKNMGTGLGPCFIMGAPGSFYDRLFPSKTLHFVYSSYSLMWLSQVPKGIENNKGNIYIGSTSPYNVIYAYYRQFRMDFNNFLKCRSEELVSGGSMVLTLLGRKSEDQSSREGYYIWELLAMVLNQMVSEGIIEEEKMDMFNIPQYTPSPGEVKLEVEKEGSFVTNWLEVSQVDWSASAKGFSSSNTIHEHDGYGLAECMRAVAEPMLANHFCESIIDDVFQRYGDILCDRMTKEDPKFYNVTIVMVKK